MSWYICKDQSIHSWCILKHFIKLLSLSRALSVNFHVNGRCSFKHLFPSPSSLSKIPSIWALSFLPLPFLLLLFSLRSSGEMWVILNLFLSTFCLSHKYPGNGLAKKLLYLAGRWEIKFLNSVLSHGFPSSSYIFQTHSKKLGNDYTYKHSCLKGKIFPVLKFRINSFLIGTIWPLNY